MFEQLAGLFGNGGALQTGTQYSPASQGKMDNIWADFNSGKISADDAAFHTGNVEKGSILGMTPSAFQNMAGGIAGAIAPKDSWQAKLGGLAAQMGSQKMAQLAQAEKEKRMTDILKQILGQSTGKVVAGVAGPDGLSPSTGAGDVQNKDLSLAQKYQ